MFGKSKNETSTDDARTKIGTMIGVGTVLDGELSSSEAVRIDGIVNGNCTCEKKLILSAEGQIRGNITAQSVIISGKVDGDIVVSGKLELLSTGKISGNITAASIVIDEGARFDGRCTMTASIENYDADTSLEAMRDDRNLSYGQQKPTGKNVSNITAASNAADAGVRSDGRGAMTASAGNYSVDPSSETMNKKDDINIQLIKE